MVTLKLPFIVIQKSKGREYAYFRRDGEYTRVPLPTDPRFEAKYEALKKRSGAFIPGDPQIPGSFGALVESFLSSAAYKGLTPKVRYEYRRHLDAMKKGWGDLPVNRLTRKGVMAYKAGLSDTPRTAYAAMQVLRRLLNFAIDQGLITVNPALRPGRNKSKQFEPWSTEALQTFREKNADKYPDMVLALDLGLTGQRRGDVIAMTERDYNGRRISVAQNKTGERVWVPVHASLKAALDARGKRHVMLLTSPQGKAFKPTHFSHRFKKAADHAGLTGLSFHGLRVTAAVMLAEAGCSETEIQSILGHRTVAMSAYYRRQADRQKNAEAAVLKLEQHRSKV